MNTNGFNLIGNLIGQLGIPDKSLILSLTEEFQVKQNPRYIVRTEKEISGGGGKRRCTEGEHEFHLNRIGR